METPEQASRFNRRLVNAFLRANTQPSREAGQLHVAIIGRCTGLSWRRSCTTPSGP